MKSVLQIDIGLGVPALASVEIIKLKLVISKQPSVVSSTLT